MSKFIVSTTLLKKFLSVPCSCNQKTCKFSSVTTGKKGGGKKISIKPENVDSTSLKVPLIKSKSTKFASKKSNKLEIISQPELQSFDRTKFPKMKSNSTKPKRLTFSNTDANGLPLLNPKDCHQRVEFASKMLALLETRPELLDDIIFSDEGNFHLSPPPRGTKREQDDVTIKMKSFHSDALQRYGESKRLPQIVWCGMTSKYIIGPYFFNSHVTDRTYIKMLQSYLIHQLKGLRGEDKMKTWWFQQDGNPPHRTSAALTYLKDTFGPQLISYGCPLLWPPRSQDLTPLDYFLWDHLKLKLKDNCFPEQLSTPASFRTSLAAQIDEVDEEVIKRVVAQFRARLEKCIESNGERFDFVDDKTSNFL